MYPKCNPSVRNAYKVFMRHFLAHRGHNVAENNLKAFTIRD